MRTPSECRPCPHMTSALDNTHRPPHAYPPTLRFTHARLMNFTERLLSRSGKTTRRTPVLSGTQVNPRAYFLVLTSLRTTANSLPAPSTFRVTTPPTCFMKPHPARALSPPTVHRPPNNLLPTRSLCSNSSQYSQNLGQSLPGTQLALDMSLLNKLSWSNDCL